MKEKTDNRKRVILGYTRTELSDITGLHPVEVSLALSGKRLLGRDKLLQVYEANLPLELFVFGENFYRENINEDA